MIPETGHISSLHPVFLGFSQANSDQLIYLHPFFFRMFPRVVSALKHKLTQSKIYIQISGNLINVRYLTLKIL